jgi:S1-C subfamily serine protease
LRLKEREALVVVKSPATESDSLSLEQGDVILAADGQIIGDAMLFRNKMDQNPKSKVELTLIREGKEISRTVAASDLCSPPKVYRIGVQVEPPSEALRSQLSLTANEGLIVLEVTEDSPAKASGVEVHDILMQVDQSQLSTFDDLKESINKSRGNEVQLRLVRKGKPMTLRVKPIAEQESEDRAFMLQLNRESKSNCPALRGHIMEVPASKP